MNPSLFGDTRHALVLAAFAVAGIALTVRADRTSEARANRLHRADQVEEAAAIYQAHVEADPEATRLRYNLGTTLLRLGATGAYEELAAGTASESERQRARASYNLGLWNLIQALVVPETDSILYYAANAIEANKAALRIDPEHENAKWNLALARRVLETSGLEQALMDPGDISGPDNIGEQTVSSAPMQLANREGLVNIMVVGEAETLAGDDLEPLSQLQANEILGSGHLDPSRITAKMLNRVGRSWRQRGYLVEGPPH
jgi:tetratricopeptide (TPR) repeat protein